MCSFSMAVSRPTTAASVLMFCVNSAPGSQLGALQLVWKLDREITLMMSLTASSNVISSLKSCFRMFWAPWLLAPMAVAFHPP